MPLPKSSRAWYPSMFYGVELTLMLLREPLKSRLSLQARVHTGSS